MLEIIQNRRSIRRFNDEPISEEQIKLLLKAGLLAPSSMNKKPVRLVAVQNLRLIAALAECKNVGTSPLITAPLAIVVLADSQLSDVWVEDASIAAAFIQLEAEALGLGSTWIQLRCRQSDSGDSEQAVRKLLELPAQLGVLCVLAIGHKDEHKVGYSDEQVDFTRVRWEK